MKKGKLYIQALLGATILLSFSCDEEEKLVDERKAAAPVVTAPTAGTASLAKYVAIGSSVTQGFTDAAHYPAGQANSFPAILATQLATAGGGQFQQPNISTGNGFGGLNTDNTVRGRSFINTTAGAPPSQAILFTVGSPLQNSTVSANNNFGVAGARLIDAVVPGYGTLNPFFGRFQSGTSATILADALAANPTFFTFWMGDNDVLGYATNGGAAGEAFAPTNPATLTDVTTFTTALSGILTQLSQNNRQGVVLNIPPVTVLPYFQVTTSLTAAGFRLIPMDAPTAAAVNQAYAAYNGGLLAAQQARIITEAERISRTIQFVAGNNPPVITDESLTDLTGLNPGLIRMRMATAADRYPLTAIQIIGTRQDPNNPASVFGVGVPIPDQFTLTLSEQVAVITRTTQFNAIIAQQVASFSNLTLVDIHPIYANLFGLTAAQAAQLGMTPAGQAAADGVLGIREGSVTLVPLSLSATSLFSSVFSSDGIHPNGQGAALIANEIIKGINQKWGATVPAAVVSTYPSIRVN